MFRSFPSNFISLSYTGHSLWDSPDSPFRTGNPVHHPPHAVAAPSAAARPRRLVGAAELGSHDSAGRCELEAVVERKWWKPMSCHGTVPMMP